VEQAARARSGRSGVSQDADLELVRRAVDGQPAARHALVLRLSPIVQRRVCRPLASSHAARQRRAERSEVLDLTQQVLLLLFDRDSRVLRSWDPERGLSLANFVGLVAEREAKAILRSGRRSAWAEKPTSEDDVSAFAVDERALEDQVVSREELQKIWHRLEEQLSPRGIELFHALLIEQLAIEEIAERFNMSCNALYTFRSRLRQQVQEIRRQLTSTPQPASVASVHHLPLSASLGRGRRSFGGEP
jgi:DNA-directed RNA polymerase specialized sigma24 family protein